METKIIATICKTDGGGVAIIRRNVSEGRRKPEHHYRQSADLDARRSDMCNRDIKKVGNIVGGVNRKAETLISQAEYPQHYCKECHTEM